MEFFSSCWVALTGLNMRAFAWSYCICAVWISSLGGRSALSRRENRGRVVPGKQGSQSRGSWKGWMKAKLWSGCLSGRKIYFHKRIFCLNFSVCDVCQFITLRENIPFSKFLQCLISFSIIISQNLCFRISYVGWDYSVMWNNINYKNILI